MFLAISLGKTDNNAQVSQVSVAEIDCADVHISTFQATVALAFGVGVPTSKVSHCQVTALYC
jgi:homoaconitase/3-isopropylmalate dehydratase large subunit